MITRRERRALCEGRAAAAQAMDSNPHDSSTPEGAAWAQGHASWTAEPQADEAHNRDDCADLPCGGYVPRNTPPRPSTRRAPAEGLRAGPAETAMEQPTTQDGANDEKESG